MTTRPVAPEENGLLPEGFDVSLFSEMVEVRRDLHMHPELSWEEERTAAKISDFLTKRGIEHQTGVAGTGIVATLPGRDDSRGWVALRADIDALPIHEETGLPFASRFPDKMHACGHDGHTSMVLGAASLLAGEVEKSGALPAPVKLIFQPGEESGNGALRMIEEGVTEGVACIFGGHIDRHYPLGTIVVSEGPVNASSDHLEIRITGRGGHAARPHETVDAVVVASLLVMAIQTIVSREVNPAHPSVVTIGTIEAGSAPNVIADDARLTGTIRAQDPEVRSFLHDSIRRIGAATGQLHGAEVSVTVTDGTPPVVNPEPMAALCRGAAEEVAGMDGVRSMEVANMGAEDFGYYMEKVPGCYVRFGSVGEGQEPYPAHSSRFDFDEHCLAFGAAYFHELALQAGRRLAEGDLPAILDSSP